MNSGSVSQKNGVYTIITGFQDIPSSKMEAKPNGIHMSDSVPDLTSRKVEDKPNGIHMSDHSVPDLTSRKVEDKPNGRCVSDDEFRIVDFVVNTDRPNFISPVYVVEDDNNVANQTSHSTGRYPTEDPVEIRGSNNKNGTEINNEQQSVAERNSVIIDGEEVFLRKSPQDSNPRSSRQQTWKNNQNVVSEAFGFLMEIDDNDERKSSNLINGHIVEKLSLDLNQEQRSQIARQPTWIARQDIVSEAFGFLKGIDDRLSGTSISDPDVFSQPETLETIAYNKEKNDGSTVVTSVVRDHNNKEILSEHQNGSFQNFESQSDLKSSSEIEKLESTNQNGTSEVSSSNQRRLSETGSVASEGVGELEGFKKYKLRSHNNGDDDADSSDEDVGEYRESFRKSTWLYIGEVKNKGGKPDDYIPLTDLGLDTCDTDSVFGDNLLDLPPTPSGKSVKRNESISTTVSEREFQNNFNSVSKRFVKRADSQQEYKRYTQKFYDNVETYNIEKTERDSFGIHILDSTPAVVSGIDEGSPAERAGLKEGQVVISVNGINVLDSNHEEIIQLVHKDKANLTLEVGSGDLTSILKLQLPVLTGYMQKQTSSTLFRLWKKRYFILRRDNCLYYYKTEKESDPLGAIPLYGYTFSRHGDSNKFAFKAEKYNNKTYYFLADSRESMTSWVGALSDAGKRQDERKDSWMEVTANNVGLPALEIRKPDCSGYLNKLGRTTKRWRKKYCVLKDACIYYYKNSNSKEAEGVAHLHGYTVDKLGLSTKKLSFCLEPPEKQMRLFVFYAENETDKQRWIDALNTSIQKWVKVD